MLDKIHSSHLGIDGCLRRARECLYLPGMNAELKDYIQTCDVCASVGINQPKEPLMPHAIERRPWSKVGVDLFHVHDRNYVVTVNYFSGFWEIDFLQDTTSNRVIHKLKGQFARHGIPDVCMSDNGPQLAPMSSNNLHGIRNSDIQHLPRFPQSNGRAEQAVKMQSH
ncbi:hypothetical protein BSL78_06330 [Apostichopus japonicus]|uniref:Integrase catalytic domain-containing protein n=1 Tax=Stichopus japonicus TaxID=307972 RepID=A0A2G8L918_STIJA|nr:hypothetical protein BSL78_06330 [Apostichopus japonicus]